MSGPTHSGSAWGFLKKHYETLATILFDLFLLWIIVRFAMGGWDRAVELLPHQGPMFWVELIVLVSLLLIKSNFKYDIPLYLAAILLAYWGEWWGTSRDVWSYFGTDGLPTYVVLTWGLCLLTVYHLYLIVRGIEGEKERKLWTWIKASSLFVFPLIGLILTWKGIMRIDWTQVVDVHFFGGIIVCGFLILKNFDLNETFWILVCGTLLGALYEYCGTATGNWSYATGEGMPLVIAPLWGLACVGMIKLGFYLRSGVLGIAGFLGSRFSARS
jgi:hypothetical protein